MNISLCVNIIYSINDELEQANTEYILYVILTDSLEQVVYSTLTLKPLK